MAGRCMSKRHLLRAAGFASASGMVTAGATAAPRSATDLNGAQTAPDLETRPMLRPGFSFLFLILRSVAKRCVSKDGPRASWFETREDALLTMRDRHYIRRTSLLFSAPR